MDVLHCIKRSRKGSGVLQSGSRGSYYLFFWFSSPAVCCYTCLYRDSLIKPMQGDYFCLVQSSQDIMFFAYSFGCVRILLDFSGGITELRYRWYRENVPLAIYVHRSSQAKMCSWVHLDRSRLNVHLSSLFKCYLPLPFNKKRAGRDTSYIIILSELIESGLSHEKMTFFNT